MQLVRRNDKFGEATVQTYQDALTDVHWRKMYGLNVGNASCQLAFKSLQVLGLARFARHRHPVATKCPKKGTVRLLFAYRAKC